MLRHVFGLTGLLALAAISCSSSSTPATTPTVEAGPPPPAPITWKPIGSLSAASGKGSFRFGAATAATQIEDQNTHTDWYVFTQPVAMGGLGKGAAFIGNAVDGYTLAQKDIALLEAMHVDSYRFSMEWARIEPEQGMIDETALQHYSDVLDSLVAAHIRPLVTIHHFSNPVWIDDPRDTGCTGGPSATNLCGLGHPTGGPMVIKAFAAHAKLLAERFGDRVDEWGLVNEPVNYLVAAYGAGEYPPGKVYIFQLLEQFIPVLRDYMSAYVAMYDAVKTADTKDADGDGIAASVGMSLSTEEWVPARNHKVSANPDDIAAQASIEYVFNHLWVDSILGGTFDPTLSGKPSESHPDWKGKIDWLGVQYYSRVGVTASEAFFPVVNLTPCLPPLDFGACIPPLDPTYCVPVMQYEYDAAGLYGILVDFGKRWPNLPLVVSEHGLQTNVPERRAENLVRGLEQIDRARQAGVDVRGYYEWALFDNFEWALGLVPHFGLYATDDKTFERTATPSAVLFGDIIESRTLTSAHRVQYGGTGPLTQEAGGVDATGLCKNL
jgi:beta-glucosidase/6-phospho-beta-glucosidase/beta-galactosidase